METRYRNWATVLYPESAPEDWKEKLIDLKTPVYVSPLHDQDVNPGGEKKKAHYHIVLTFEGKKSRDQIKVLTDSFGGVGQEVVNSLRGYVRYLCHLDNPEKYRYNENDIQCFGGADYDSIIGFPVAKYKALKEMQTFVRQKRIIRFADLADYAAEERPDWYKILTDCGTLYMTSYIKSCTWGWNNGVKQERSNETEKPNNGAAED